MKNPHLNIRAYSKHSRPLPTVILRSRTSRQLKLPSIIARPQISKLAIDARGSADVKVCPQLDVFAILGR